MASAQERVEYLLESEDCFGDKIPPFTRRGLPESRKKNVSVRLKGNGQIQRLEYRRYRSTDSTYATLRLNGLTYIVMALPQGWKRGNETNVHGGCRCWFAWQGPRQQFLGQRFRGAVAVSTSRSERLNDMKSDSTPSSSRSFSHTFNTSSTSPLQRSSELSPPPSETDSGSASSDYLPTSKNTNDLDEQDAPEGQGMSRRRAPRGSIGNLHAVPPCQPRDPSRTLTRQEEAAIWMRICVPGEENNFRPMFLSSARPASDSQGSVTHRSLFEKVTRVCMSGKPEIQHLEVMIDERDIFEARHSPNTVRSNQVCFRVGREEEESWHLFVICLKDYIARNGLDGWHLVILAHVLT